MQFAVICIVSLAALGVVAALASVLTKGGTDAHMAKGHDGCYSCSSVADGSCKLGCMMEEKRRHGETTEQ